MAEQEKFWVVVPAAGTGSRSGGPIPKQYRKFAGKTLIEHTLDKLDRVTRIERILVCLHPHDCYWSTINLSAFSKSIQTIEGGDTRAASVLNGLQWLRDNVNIGDDQFVLIHDAARPCVSLAEMNELLESCSQHAVGGLLGFPVVDTLKSVSESDEVKSTMPRDGLWRALTPQMFRYKLLLDALQNCAQKGLPITDESSAVEQMGWTPKMVKGRSTNIKFTYPEDAQMIEMYLQETEKG